MKQITNILLKNVKKNGLEYLQDSKAFIQYSNDMQDIYKINEDCNTSRKCIALIINRI